MFTKKESVVGVRLFSTRQLWFLVIPLVIEKILDVSIGFIDTLMIASVGEAAVSSISLVDSINNLFLFLFSALAAGGAIVVAQYVGQKNAERAGVAAKQLIYTTTIVALLFSFFFLLFNKQLLSLVFGSLDPDVMEKAQTYFILTALSYPFIGLFNSGAALFRAMGNSNISMKVSIVMTLSNIGGNALLIYGLNLGVFGSGLATLISRILAASVMVYLLLAQKGKIRINKLFSISFDWLMIKRILRIGLPNSFESGIFHIGKIMVQSLTATFGTTAIAANAIASSIASLLNVPGAAIGLATITIIGQCMGAQEIAQAEQYAKKLLLSSYIILLFVSALLFLATSPIITLFNLSPEASQTAKDLLIVLFIINTLLWPLSFTLPQALRAAGDIRYTMCVSIMSMWIFRVGFSYLVARGMGLGLMGIWIAMYIDWLCRSICFVLRFMSGKWKTKQVI